MANSIWPCDDAPRRLAADATAIERSGPVHEVRDHESGRRERPDDELRPRNDPHSVRLAMTSTHPTTTKAVRSQRGTDRRRWRPSAWSVSGNPVCSPRKQVAPEPLCASDVEKIPMMSWRETQNDQGRRPTERRIALRQTSVGHDTLARRQEHHHGEKCRHEEGARRRGGLRRTSSPGRRPRTAVSSRNASLSASTSQSHAKTPASAKNAGGRERRRARTQTGSAPPAPARPPGRTATPAPLAHDRGGPATTRAAALRTRARTGGGWARVSMLRMNVKSDASMRGREKDGIVGVPGSIRGVEESTWTR